MKTLMNQTLQAVLLIAILGFYGWQLTRNAWILHGLPQMQQVTSDRNRTLVFQSEAGIDILGRPVYPIFASGTKRTIIFLLRSASVKKDLDFWRQVESLLAKNTGPRLVGYCDGDECAEAVRHDARPTDFPVVAYGEITSTQALVNADAEGSAILRNGSLMGPKRLAWRAQGKTPQSVIQEALK
jgi:hypothetical protein